MAPTAHLRQLCRKAGQHSTALATTQAANRTLKTPGDWPIVAQAGAVAHSCKPSTWGHTAVTPTLGSEGNPHKLDLGKGAVKVPQEYSKNSLESAPHVWRR